MPEEKKEKIKSNTKDINTKTSSSTNDGKIDFSQLTMWKMDTTEHTVDINKNIEKQKDSSATSPVQKPDRSADIMATANKIEGEKTSNTQINLDKLNIPTAPQIKKEKSIKLWDSWIGVEMYGRRFEVSYRRVFLISFAIIVFFSLLSIILRSYSKYLTIASKPVIEPVYQPLVQKYDSYEQKISKYLPFTKYDEYRSLKIFGDSQKEKNLDKILSAQSLHYIHKKNIIQNNIDELTQEIFKEFQNLNTVKQNVTKFGFLSKDIYDILDGKKQMQPIKKSLLSLELIKFSSAMRVFSYLDTFLEWFATIVGGSPQDIGNHIQNLIARGENDIYVYLNNCYLNPFEWDYDCKVIGDFDTYYDLIQNDSSFDKAYFKKLIKYIDLKLEQTQIPSFSIVFRSFDPSKDTIRFSIDVNTFQKDEIALLKKNILNPHMFVLTQLLNLLKQSRFIVGESIDVKKLNIQDKIVQIWSQQFHIKNSQMSFSLPIQKFTQREIFDFIWDWSLWDGWVKTIQLTHQNDTNHASADQIVATIQQKSKNISPTDNVVHDAAWLTFAEEYADKILNIQRTNTKIQYLLQEQWEEKLLNKRAKEIEKLETIDGFSQNTIQGVFDYTIKYYITNDTVIDLGSLRTKNSSWKTLFQVLLESVEQQKMKDLNNKENNQKNQGVDTGVVPVTSTDQSSFSAVKNFFSSWMHK